MGNPVRRFSSHPKTEGMMCMPIEDLTGKRFGMLTVIELAYTKDRKNYWLCRCDCGNVKIIRQDSFKTSRKQKTVVDVIIEVRKNAKKT